MEEVVKEKLKESAQTKLQLNAKVIADIAEAIIGAYKSKKKVVLFGNGGSAADAQHIAAELVGKYKLVREPLPALALSTNTSILTACANDYGYDTVFAKQVGALVEAGDVVIGISTSGTSPNVLEGIKLAKEKGAVTVGFTGEGREGLGGLVDLWLSVPSKDTPRIQESHITAGHIICFLVEQALFGEQG
ncbi:MAG: D-sedoheptulose 7-phosphate isomerase [Thermoplasmata archaeon]|nr:MAG: D-sedoheptulose 7-phosphate isomerase [Thermoplasmata archaeon]